ncbi:hypothetical protein V7128_05870 [Neobacillus vireti]|uniref:hypothetical protein n=1 Tax=Neobacillus vireti TaxID=220686 RepID=UPI00300070AB
MVKVFKFLFGVNAILNLVTGISILATGKGQTLAGQVVDSFTLTIFFGLFAIADYSKTKKEVK